MKATRRQAGEVEFVTVPPRERGPMEVVSLPLWMESAPHSGSKTSRDAAADIREHAHKQRARVLAYLASRGALGATDQEIELDLGMVGNSVRPRRGELLESGCIADSGETRKTLAGRKAVVWRFKP